MRNDERVIYEKNLEMLNSEIDINLYALYDMRALNEQNYILKVTSDDITKSIISNPQTYVFTGLEYRTLLQNYLAYLDALRSQIVMLNEARFQG